MEDGQSLLPKSVNCDQFLFCLNNLHPSIVLTLESAKVVKQDGKTMQVLDFLDITIILHSNGKIETDVHYKLTNAHKYLNFTSFHPRHCKENIPYNLAKRIIVFVTNSEKMEHRLKEMEKWLIECGYPLQLIKKKVHNARLQGPAPKPDNCKNTMPFVTTYMSNVDSKPLMNTVRTLIESTKTPRLQEVFKQVKVVVGYKQPPNLKKMLTKASFKNSLNVKGLRTKLEPGIFASCKDIRCKICKLDYIQQCTSFETANGKLNAISTVIVIM